MGGYKGYKGTLISPSPRTTNLRVRSSNLFGRATKFLETSSTNGPVRMTGPFVVLGIPPRWPNFAIDRPVGSRTNWKRPGDIALSVLATPVEAAAVVGLSVAAAVAGGMEYFSSEGPAPSFKTIDSWTELEASKLYADRTWTPETFYFEHPKEAKLLVRAKSFHAAMADEQMRDLVAFYGSIRPVSRIRIVMESRNDAKAQAGGTSQADPVSADASFNRSLSAELIEQYETPEVVPLENPPRWMDRFQSLLEGGKRACAGSTTFSQEHDLSFGLSASAAKLFEFEASWTSRQLLRVEVTFL
jgi:hypothetical protein